MSDRTGPTIETSKPSRPGVGARHVQEAAAVRNPDAVQKRIIDFWGWVEDNAKLLAGLTILLVIAGIAHVIAHSYWKRQEDKAQEAFFKASAPYSKIKEELDRGRLKNFLPPTARGAKDASGVSPSGDLNKDYGAVLPPLEQVARDFRGTSAGSQAAILVSETYLEYKNPDKAIEFAELPTRSLARTHVLSQLARVLLGSGQAAKGDCPAAVKVWQDVLDDKSAAFLHAEAGLRSGLCYESLNQPAKAMEMYRKVSNEDAQGVSGSTAKGLLRALEIKATAPQKG